MAGEWKEAVDRGGYASRADLTRKKMISRARVTQILNLLKLDAEVQEMIVKQGDPMESTNPTERRLRGIVGLSTEEQRQKLKTPNEWWSTLLREERDV